MTTTLLSQERARQMVELFVQRFEESYRLLAYHAALPLLLTPELVNFLRVQFLRSDNVPWVAEVDLLLSDLCSQVGYELYAMDTAVRAYLLEEMEQELGKQRMQDVAKVLISYVKHLAQTNPYISQQELQAQQWAAMVYLDTQRERVVSEIAQSFKNVVSEDEMLRLGRITQELAPQLSAYGNLVAYAKLVTQVLSNSSDIQPEGLHRSYEVLPDVELSLPPELISTIERSPVSLPSLQVFEFEVVTVKLEAKRGQQPRVKINRCQGRANFFVEDLGNGITLDLVEIPAGTFMMGASENEEGSSDSEYPQHQVTVPPFFMSKYPVTQAQWKAVAALPRVNRDLKPDPSYFKDDRRNRPVEQISWYEAVEFCARLSNHIKREFRLPSEAEWEYACRAGTMTPFHFGETITTDLANYDGNETYGNGSKGEYRERTTSVGSFPPNAFGLYDMHGNVSEWCADTWHSSYQGTPTNGSAWVEENKNQARLLRGGSWISSPVACRSAYRSDNFPDFVINGIGFRVVCGVARTLFDRF